MSTRRTEDPSGQRYVTDRLVRKYEGILTQIEYTLLAQTVIEESLIEDLFAWGALMMLGALEAPIQVSMNRAFYTAARDVNMLSPDFAVTGGWTPADNELREQLTKQHRSYVQDLIKTTREKVTQAVKEGDAEAIQQVFTAEKNHATQIARTELMNAYNTASRKRYESWGVKKYRFHAHLDCCKEPKELKDGSVVQRGCEELHNQIFPVTDGAHCPPVHTLCRCCILPVI